MHSGDHYWDVMTSTSEDTDIYGDIQDGGYATWHSREEFVCSREEDRVER
jgi:hypothetical protein